MSSAPPHGWLRLRTVKTRQSSRSRAAPLTVLTWNISYEALHPAGVRTWPDRAGDVARVIGAVDIAAVQELSGRQVRDIAALLATHEAVNVRFRPDDELRARLERRYRIDLEPDIGELALFVRTERLAVTDRGHWSLSPTPDVELSTGWGNETPRQVLWAILEDRETRAHCLVATTHVDLAAVRPMLRQLAAELGPMAERHRSACLLGDLNTVEDPEAFKLLLAAGWRDAHPTGDLAADPSFLGALDGRPGRIDHILVHGTASAAGWHLATSADAGLSDHLAVGAEVTF
jgi:endonuclease/exonuclease/phosphatase family metal-dependent hydrolase